MKYVLDASVVIKWFVKEEDSEVAIELLNEYNEGKCEIAVPDLLIYEVANVLRYNPRFSHADTLRCIQSIHNLDLDIVDLTEIIVEFALRISYERKISFYDALYVAVAREIGYEFITADENLYGMVTNLPFVSLLKNLKKKKR